MLRYYNIFFNWLLFIISFIILNYNLYNLLCTFSIFNFIIIHNFFYYFLYLKEFLEFNYFFNIDLYILIYKNQWYNYFIQIYDLKKVKESFFIIINNYLDVLKIMNNSYIYCVYFDTKVIGNRYLIFLSLQNKVFILPGETSLCFFRIINNNNYNVYGIPIYIISPFEFSSFITKIQCFCFEEIFIFPYEIIELPILFFINSKISSLSYIFLNEFSIEYIFFCNLIT
jgi:hypothetical protein